MQWLRSERCSTRADGARDVIDRKRRMAVPYRHGQFWFDRPVLDETSSAFQDARCMGFNNVCCRACWSGEASPALTSPQNTLNRADRRERGRARTVDPHAKTARMRRTCRGVERAATILARVQRRADPMRRELPRRAARFRRERSAHGVRERARVLARSGQPARRRPPQVSRIILAATDRYRPARDDREPADRDPGQPRSGMNTIAATTKSSH